ncbi:MAG: hypothetical protein ACTSRC_20465 [Candidatus Helarchaeota archaeon]
MKNKTLTLNEFRDHQFTLGDCTFIRAFLGAGKTHYISRMIEREIKDGFSVVVIMPDHNAIKEFLKDYKPSYNYIHIKGKTQADMCKKPINKKYVFGCKNCDRDCGYWRNRKEVEKKIKSGPCVFFIVPQACFWIKKIDPTVVFIDENISNVIFTSIRIPPKYLPYFKVEEMKCLGDRCPCKKRCESYRRNKKSVSCLLELFYGTPQLLKIVKSIEPTNDDEYFLLEAIKRKKKIVAFKDRDSFEAVIFKEIDFSRHEIVICDATASPEFVELTIGRKIDKLIQVETEMNNKVIQISKSGTLNMTKQYIDKIPSILHLLKFPNSKETLIVCKKKYKERIKNLVNCHVIHYGAARATNKYKDCKYVILFGHYKLRNETIAGYLCTNPKLKYKILIDNKETAEHKQACGRIRFYFDETKQIAFFMIGESIPYRPTEVIEHFDKTLEVLEHLDEYIGLSKTEFRKKIKTSNYKKILENLVVLGHIKSLNGYGVKIERA